jgi:hypothetical protein
MLCEIYHIEINFSNFLQNIFFQAWQVLPLSCALANTGTKNIENQGEHSVTFIKLFTSSILLTIFTIVAMGQNPSVRENQNKTSIRSSINRLSENIKVAPAGGNPVSGSGTPGQLAKWTGVDGSNSYSLGNSLITEDKFGKVGIGTTTPTSKLTVQGMVETTLGGYKFPDGTIQTTAFSPDQVVKSLNGLHGDLTLAPGANITITPSGGNTLAIAAPNVLTMVSHNTTLSGNGTQGSPLSLAVPLTLTGTLSVINTDTPNLMSAIVAQGFNSSNNDGGDGLVSSGGKVTGQGNLEGGVGVIANGGDNLVSANGFGGSGIVAWGGGGAISGAGVIAHGGTMPTGSGDGGDALLGVGGNGRGAGKKSGAGIYVFGGTGFDGAADGLAGFFSGDVEVQGNFNVTGGGSKNFKIDHPLDPENKYLYHAAIESSEVLNVYSGNITTDGSGEAVVTLPDWFEAINKDFRYQLTVVGTFAQAIVAEEIKSNTFKIKTNAAGVKVSWQVTGVRSDAAILKHPFKLEENKSQSERGSYLTPDAYNQSEERGVNWARNPQLMQQIKQQRIEAEQGKQQKPVNR